MDDDDDLSLRLAKIAENQDGDGEEVVPYESRYETLESDSNFSDLERKRLENRENLLFFFLLNDPESIEWPKVGPT